MYNNVNNLNTNSSSAIQQPSEAGSKLVFLRQQLENLSQQKPKPLAASSMSAYGQLPAGASDDSTCRQPRNLFDNITNTMTTLTSNTNTAQRQRDGGSSSRTQNILNEINHLD